MHAHRRYARRAGEKAHYLSLCQRCSQRRHQRRCRRRRTSSPCLWDRRSSLRWNISSHGNGWSVPSESSAQGRARHARGVGVVHGRHAFCVGGQWRITEITTYGAELMGYKLVLMILSAGNSVTTLLPLQPRYSNSPVQVTVLQVPLGQNTVTNNYK